MKGERGKKYCYLEIPGRYYTTRLYHRVHGLRVSIYLGDPFPEEPSTSSRRSFSNYCPRPGCTLARIDRVRTGSIKYKSRILAQPFFDTRLDIPVYSPRVTASRQIFEFTTLYIHISHFFEIEQEGNNFFPFSLSPREISSLRVNYTFALRYYPYELTTRSAI